MKTLTGALAPRVPKAVYRLWKYLESLHRQGGWISVGIRHLMAKYHRKESTVKAWFGALFKAGILASKRRGPHPPVYTVLIPTFDTCKQAYLFTEHEEPEKESLPQALRSSTDTAIQHHPREDAVPLREGELKRLAGLEGKRTSPGDRAFVAALQEPLEVIRAGILLGRARKMVQNAATGRNEAIHSLRYFANTIREAASLSAGYEEYLAGFIRRHERAS